jgi:hypothetical protein
MSDWNDLFVRTSLGERSPDGRVGLSSPDIVRAGVSPMDPFELTREDNYQTYPRSKPFPQRAFPNYLYVRAKNSAANTPAEGRAYLVVTNPALVLWPGSEGWTQVRTINQAEAGTLQPRPINGGSIAVTTDPFVYVPADTGHRCLVTWLSTRSHPLSQLPQIERMDQLVRFMKDTRNYAYHSIDIASTDGAVTQSIPFSSGTMSFSLRCGLQVTRCKGFTVSFSSGTPLPGGGYIGLAATDVLQDETVVYLSAAAELPANWDTHFNYTYRTNDLRPVDFEVTLVAYFDVGPEHPFWDFAKPYEHFGVPAGQAPKDRRGIVVGSIGVKAG